VIFPEGTRVAPNQRIEYSSMPATLTRYLKLPVVPVSINTNVVFGSNRKFNVDFSKTLNICFHEPLNYETVLVKALFDKKKSPKFKDYKSVPYKELTQVLTTVKLEMNRIVFKSSVIESLSHFSTVTEKPVLLFDQLALFSTRDPECPTYVYDKLFQDFVLEVAQVHHLLFEVIPKTDLNYKNDLFMSYIRSIIEAGIVRI
jgi:hypothetical protein